MGILEEFDLLLITNISSKWYFDEIIGMIKENPLIFIHIKSNILSHEIEVLRYSKSYKNLLRYFINSINIY